ncbi:MAG: hypothetical protein AAGB22_09665 [Bacteroidota bacterium]
MHRNQHLIYWVAPLLAIIVLVVTSDSNIPWLQRIIAPEINREFGLLENLQLLVLFFIMVLAWKGFRSRQQRLEKVGYGLLLLFSIVIFLEEMDYGLHYYELLFKDGFTDQEMIRNIHNQGENLFYIRQGLYTLLAILFVLLPVVGPMLKYPLVRYVSANRMIIATMAVYIVTGILARHYHGWVGLPVNPPLWGNHQEFEELVVYYMFMLYLWDIVLFRGPIPLGRLASASDQ